MRRFRILDSFTLAEKQDVIDTVISEITAKGEYPWYDPMDVGGYTQFDIVDIMMALHYFAEHVVEEDTKASQYYALPKNIIMVTTSLGIEGVHKDFLEVIAEELPPLTPTAPNGCLHPRKYKNTVSANLSFYVCPDCKKEV